MKYLNKKQFDRKMKELQERNHQIEFRNKLRSEKNKYRRFNLSNIKTSNVVLTASIMAVILFTIACLYIQYATSVEVSSTLITLWFSFWTVEILSLAGIKVSKILKEYKSKDDMPFFEDNDSNIM